MQPSLTPEWDKQGFVTARNGDKLARMKELLRSNDPVLLSFLNALLNDAGIPFAIVDQNMSIIEGSIGILQQRVLVADDRLDDARRLVRDAGLQAELPPDKKS